MPTPLTPAPSPGCCPLPPSGIVSRNRETGRFIDAIRINRITRQQQEGRIYWVKQRRLCSRFIIPCANTFFSCAGNPVVVWARRREWQQWEVSSYLLLHAAEGYHAFAGANLSVWAEELPGFALETPAKENRITPGMLAAAARELRRAHDLPSPALGGEGWSHGDAHLDNFIYDSTTDRARLVDFEVAHRSGMSTADRQIDDLLVMVQSTMGYWPLEQWLAHSRLIVSSYLEGTPSAGHAALLHRLGERLHPPTGMSRVWWSIRTDYIPASDRNAKIAALRASLKQPA